MEKKKKKVTTDTLRRKKQRGEPITMLTAYDWPTAGALDQAGIDAVLVGDSLGMVVLGHPNTLPVTMEDMLHHCKAVRRGILSALLIGDMPFLSYQTGTAEAVSNAGRFLKEAGADSVKLEGGRERVDTVRALLAAGIPVMGHLGMTPQRVHQMGGWKVQGRSLEIAKRMVEDALILEECGCFAIVLEVIPGRLAGLISKRLKIPTIGIGAGDECDGQVLVSHDVLGMHAGSYPKFAKRYADFYGEMVRAFRSYRDDVIERRYPLREDALSIDEEVFQEVLAAVGGEHNKPPV